MRAHWHVWQLTRDDCLEAFRLIDEVLQRDPKNAIGARRPRLQLELWGPLRLERRAVSRSQRASGGRRASRSRNQRSGRYGSRVAGAIRAVLEPARRCDPALESRDCTRPKFELRARQAGSRIQLRGRARPLTRGPRGSNTVEPARLPDGNLAYRQRVVAPTRGALRRGGELRQPGDRIQSGVSGRVLHAGRGSGASRTHGGGARRARYLCASVAWIDVGRPAADPAVPPPRGPRALSYRPAEGGAVGVRPRRAESARAMNPSK